MSGDVVDVLLQRVHAYVLRVMKDPNLLQTTRGEFQAVIDAWKVLGRLLPGIAGIGAEEFQKILLSQGTKSLHERMAFAARWLQSQPSPSTTPPQAAKTFSPAPSQGNVAPLQPPLGATAAQLMQYQRNLGKYNRMFEMYSKILSNSHEMKKALIGNLPR